MTPNGRNRVDQAKASAPHGTERSALCTAEFHLAYPRGRRSRAHYVEKPPFLGLTGGKQSRLTLPSVTTAEVDRYLKGGMALPLLRL